MIKVKNLTKSFDDFKALEDVDISIEKGSIFGLVGANGAGKSTLLRVLTGIYVNDSGSVSIEDKPVYENEEIKEKIQFVPDELYFLPGASLKRMAKFYSAVYPSFDYERFNALVDTFHIDVKKNIHNFSKGMKRQAAIILALACKPKYLFLDESFDGLDPVIRNLVKSVICRYVEEENMTVVISSHSLRELEGLCDTLGLLYGGKVVFTNEISEIKTSFFKVQLALNYEYDETEFSELEVLKYSRQGVIANLIIKGDREECLNILNKKNPAILEMLPMSLEEVFTYELAALGYSFDMDLRNKGDESDDKSKK